MSFFRFILEYFRAKHATKSKARRWRPSVPCAGLCPDASGHCSSGHVAAAPVTECLTLAVILLTGKGLFR